MARNKGHRNVLYQTLTESCWESDARVQIHNSKTINEEEHAQLWSLTHERNPDDVVSKKIYFFKKGELKELVYAINEAAHHSNK